MDAMQTVKNQKESSTPISGDEKLGAGPTLHSVYITDNTGIDRVFERIKSRLREEQFSCLTLIYSIIEGSPVPLFSGELETIERRFPAQLITYYVPVIDLVFPCQPERFQSQLEIVINSNICKHMQFMVHGEASLVEVVVGRLTFLGINATQIHSQIL
jgi:hypothetical protein